jgi:hypothetical protein
MGAERVMVLVPRQCVDCGDELVTLRRVPVCLDCERRAILRQRLARQPGARAIRQAASE